MSYSHDRLLGIFYMHYHIDMITYGILFVKPVGSTGGTYAGRIPLFLSSRSDTGLKH